MAQKFRAVVLEFTIGRIDHMAQLVDIHGIPMDLEQVTAFRVVPREVIYYPAYQEIQNTKFSLFARMGNQDKKKFEFINLVPYGILLEAKERPHIGDYKVDSFAEAAGQSILAGLGDLIENAGNMIADIFSLDTSGNMKIRVLTTGRRVVDARLRDIPAKVRMLSGKVADVYKNDQIYQFLGEPISPTINRTKALMIKAHNETFAFFGSGIDMTDEEIDRTYHSLLGSYNQAQKRLEERRAQERNRPLIQLPRISIPFLGINIGVDPEPVKVESKDNSNNAITESNSSEQRDR